MARLKYLKKCTKSSTSVILPDENGPLCKDVLPFSIREVNLEVSEILETVAGKRKPYLKVSPEKKAIIGKYAAENGIVSALVHFA